MTTITEAQRVALERAVEALYDKADVADTDEESDYYDEAYCIIRDLVDNATIEASDTTPLWTTDEWGALTPVGNPDFSVEYYTMDKYGTGSALIDMDAVTVPIDAEHLPALIATLQEVQRRIGGEAK